MFTALAAAAAALAAAEAVPSLQVSGDPAACAVWTRVIESVENDWINDLVLLKNGNIAAAGFLGRRDDPPSDWSAVVAEIGQDGALVRKTGHGAGSGVDAFFGMLEGDDGRRALAGFTTRIGHGGIDALAVITPTELSFGRRPLAGLDTTASPTSLRRTMATSSWATARKRGPTKGASSW